MKRFLTIAGLIVVILLVFLGLINLKMRANEPEVLFKKHRRAGDERILPVLREALKSSDVQLREVASRGFE